MPAGRVPRRCGRAAVPPPRPARSPPRPGGTRRRTGRAVCARRTNSRAAAVSVRTACPARGRARRSAPRAARGPVAPRARSRSATAVYTAATASRSPPSRYGAPAPARERTGEGSTSRSTSNHTAPTRNRPARCQPGSGSGIPAPITAATSNWVPQEEATGPVELSAPARSPSTPSASGRSTRERPPPVSSPRQVPRNSPKAPITAGARAAAPRRDGCPAGR